LGVVKGKEIEPVGTYHTSNPYIYIYILDY
jgi:hypothetical protein